MDRKEFQDILTMYLGWRERQARERWTLIPPPPGHVSQLAELARLKNYAGACASLSCCGFNELAGISGYAPEQILDSLCMRFRPGTNSAYILFTQAASPYYGPPDSGYGFTFKDYLLDSGLGSVEGPIGPSKNPNSGNLVLMWAWKPDPKACEQWFIGRYPELGPHLYGANCDL